MLALLLLVLPSIEAGANIVCNAFEGIRLIKKVASKPKWVIMDEKTNDKAF